MGGSATPTEYELRDESVTEGVTYWYAIEDIDLAGRTNRSHPIQVTFEQRETLSARIPARFALLPNYPNPFNPETWFPYELAADADVTLRIFDVRGRLVRQLTLGHQPAGCYLSKEQAIHWDGRNDLGEHVPSGPYLYQLRAERFSAIRRMVVLK